MADALSRRPEGEGKGQSPINNESDNGEWQAISYSTTCRELGEYSVAKVEEHIREGILIVNFAESLYGSHKIEVVTGMVDVFYQISASVMA